MNFQHIFHAVWSLPPKKKHLKWPARNDHGVARLETNKNPTTNSTKRLATSTLGTCFKTSAWNHRSFLGNQSWEKYMGLPAISWSEMWHFEGGKPSKIQWRSCWWYLKKLYTICPKSDCLWAFRGRIPVPNHVSEANKICFIYKVGPYQLPIYSRPFCRGPITPFRTGRGPTLYNPTPIWTIIWENFYNS